MSFLRAKTISSFARRAANPIIRQHQSLRPLSSTTRQFATGYGDGEGDPKGERPQEQGTSTATRKVEHPGPSSPASDSGNGPKAPEVSSANSGGSRSKEAEETGSSPTGGSMKGSPKIHNKSVPEAESEGKKAEVEEHNREFEKGHDRAAKAEDDKVDKKFWSGDGADGAEKKP